jgi:hypothetical protein
MDGLYKTEVWSQFHRRKTIGLNAQLKKTLRPNITVDIAIDINGDIL